MKRYRQWWSFLVLTCAFLTSTTITIAQVSEKGLPESFQIDLKDAAILPSLKLDSVHVEKMLANDKEFYIDNRYGVVQPCEVNIKKEGHSSVIPGKGMIWRYKIESEEAFSLGLYFKNYHLPPKAKIFLYDPSHLRLRGAFTQRNNNPRGELPVADFPGKELIVEYFEPFDPEFEGDVVIGAVSQAYSNLQVIASNRIGINCPQGANWQQEKHSVCLMTFHDWRYSYFCTGALINNIRQDQTPFFLTANHCIRAEYVANTLVTYFNYENSRCNTYDAPENQTVAGATLKATSSYTDFSLLLLAEEIPDEYNPYFSGWDVSGNDPEWGVCIHHPNGLPKCIALDSLPITSYNEKVQWISDGLRLFSTTVPNTHWGVEFDQGSPESGSSGGPLFDQNKRIVGQLHGGANFVLLYGKLNLSWDYYPSPDKQLAYWLDPENTTKVLNGIWKIPPKANFRAQLQQVCPNTPVLFFDESTQHPIRWNWKIYPSTYTFANGTDSTSQNPQIIFFEEGTYSVSLQTTNKYGTDEVTAQNYILAKKQLNVKLLKLPNENEVCGCDLNNFPVMAGGAVTYDFKVDRPDLINVHSSSDSVYMTLNPAANMTHSFDTWVKVLGTNGICTATDSMLVHIVIQPNDHIENATRLSLGRNAGFSNFCATVEKNEPHPWSVGCSAPESWCPNTMGDYNILNNSIWFSFVSPSQGGLTISTNGFDDQIAVYEKWTDNRVYEGNKTQYTLLAANDNRTGDDHSALIEDLKLIPGKEYLLQVDGNNAAYGDLVIDLISNSLEVAPNPSTGIFHIIISNPGQGIAQVLISDLNGNKLITQNYNVNLSNNKFDIDLSAYNRGIYLLNVKINNSNLTQKLVKW
jgi:PKD repeat protein